MKRIYTLLFFTIFYYSSFAQQFWDVTTSKTGVNNVLLDIQFVNNKQGFITGKDGLVLTTNNGGDKWDVLREAEGTDYNAFVTNGERIFVASEFSRSYYSKDSGNNWTEWDLNAEKSYQVLDVEKIGTRMIAVGASTVGLQPAIFISDNFIKWEVVNHTMPDGVFIYDVCMVDAINAFIVTSEKNKLYRSTDGGANWQSIFAQGIYSDGTYTKVHFINSDTGFIITTKGELYKTEDGGFNWELTNLTDIVLNDVVFYDENLGAVATHDGIFITEDGGDTWNLFGKGTAVRSLYFKNANNLLGVGSAGNIYSFTPTGPLSVQDIFVSTDVLLKTNPVRQGDNIKLQVTNGTIKSVTIMSSEGKIVYKVDNSSNTSLTIPTGKLRGIYFIMVNTSDGTNRTLKLLVE